MSTKMLRKIVKFPHCACRFKGKREPWHPVARWWHHM
jgi:hypothetical protein